MNICNIHFRLAIAATGVFVGVLVCFTFAFSFQNVNGAVWGLVSGIWAAAALALHILYKQQKLINYYPQLRSIAILGCIGQLLGVVGFAVYITLGIVKNQDLKNVYGENMWIASVWTFMTWKWGFQLMWFARMYRIEYENTYRLEPLTSKPGNSGATESVANA